MPAVTPEREPIERLVRGEHHEPHRLLGAHLDGNQVIIRAWRPDATGVVALVGDDRVALTQIHPAGVFEGVLARTAFGVWAPNARAVRVVGDFNSWDGRLHPMRALGSSGIWELFIPGVATGARYKYELVTPSGALTLKADPVAFAAELPPKTASVVYTSAYTWDDDAWMAG